MSKPLLRAFAFLAIFASQIAFAQLPADYQDLKAHDKQALLWSNVVDSAYETPPAWKNFGFREIVKSLFSFLSLQKSFNHESDEMPAGRRKFIHTHGSVAKVSFSVDQKGPFSGVFGEGAIGLARLSLAANPALTNYTPGMALKFLIDGKPSVNLHVMNSLEGQGDDHNFFARPFSNKIAPANSWYLRILEKIFAMVKSPPGELALHHLAQVFSDGFVPESVVVPDQIVLRPHADVAKLIASDQTQDLRASLAEIPSGTRLYDVWGYKDDAANYIGYIETSSPFLASQYGDEKLFFQHQR